MNDEEKIHTTIDDWHHEEPEREETDHGPNVRVIYLDCDICQDIDVITSGWSSFVRDRTYNVKCVAECKENGIKVFTKSFEADIREGLLYGDKERAAKFIMDQFKQRSSMSISCQSTKIDGDEWETSIILSDKAKELFDLLKIHVQKLLEALV